VLRVYYDALDKFTFLLTYFTYLLRARVLRLKPEKLMTKHPDASYRVYSETAVVSDAAPHAGTERAAALHVQSLASQCPPLPQYGIINASYTWP